MTSWSLYQKWSPSLFRRTRKLSYVMSRRRTPKHLLSRTIGTKQRRSSYALNKNSKGAFSVFSKHFRVALILTRHNFGRLELEQPDALSIGMVHLHYRMFLCSRFFISYITLLTLGQSRNPPDLRHNARILPPPPYPSQIYVTTPSSPHSSHILPSPSTQASAVHVGRARLRFVF